jgi:glycine/D-amino acid oxidase-like deaminating enzyme
MSDRRPTNVPSRVVICGGGVIGTSIAYFLSLRGVETVVVERTGVANAASGKSGGFLALDWCRGTPVDRLARRSFQLHAELASSLSQGLDLDWGYRRLSTLSVAASERRNFSSLKRMDPLDWLAPEVAVCDQIGTRETTAQVHPAAFTQALMTAAEERGGRLLIGTVEGLEFSRSGERVTGVRVDGGILETDAVVVAMGPWSILACQWLQLPSVYGLKGHSLVFRYTPADPRALFVELETTSGKFETPEVMPRTDGTTYVCGLSSESALPLDPAEVSVDDGSPERLRAMVAAVSPALGRSEILAAQACYRPISEDGVPLIGPVAGVRGAFVATGHSVWGMLNGPATGEAVAELIVEGAASTIDITPFDPARLRPG